MGRSVLASLGDNTDDQDQLYKLSASCPADSWTSVELELRNPEPLPSLSDLTRFLISSVALLTHIDTLSVHLDSQRVLRIQKEVESPVDISFPEHLKPTTSGGILTVQSIQRAGKAMLVTWRHV